MGSQEQNTMDATVEVTEVVDLPAGTWHGDEDLPAGTWHGDEDLSAGTWHSR